MVADKLTQWNVARRKGNYIRLQRENLTYTSWLRLPVKPKNVKDLVSEINWNLSMLSTKYQFSKSIAEYKANDLYSWSRDLAFPVKSKMSKVELINIIAREYASQRI